MEPLAELADIYLDEETSLRRRVEAAALVLQHAASDELVADATELPGRSLNVRGIGGLQD